MLEEKTVYTVNQKEPIQTLKAIHQSVLAPQSKQIEKRKLFGKLTLSPIKIINESINIRRTNFLLFR